MWPHPYGLLIWSSQALMHILFLFPSSNYTVLLFWVGMRPSASIQNMCTVRVLSPDLIEEVASSPSLLLILKRSWKPKLWILRYDRRFYNNYRYDKTDIYPKIWCGFWIFLESMRIPMLYISSQNFSLTQITYFEIWLFYYRKPIF